MGALSYIRDTVLPLVAPSQYGNQSMSRMNGYDIHLAEKTLRLSQEQQAIQDSISAAELVTARQQQQQARDQWNLWLQTYAPRTQALVDQSWAGTPVQATAEKAGTNVEQAYSKNVEMAKRDLQRMGINQNSARYVNLLNDFTLAKSTATAGAMNMTRAGVRDANYQQKQYVVGLGAGLPSESSAMNSASGASNNAASNAISTGLSGYQAGASALSGAYQSASNMAFGAQQAGLGRSAAMTNLQNTGIWNTRAAEAGQSGENYTL